MLNKLLTDLIQYGVDLIIHTMVTLHKIHKLILLCYDIPWYDMINCDTV